MTGRKRNGAGGLTFCDLLSGAGVRFLRLLQVYAAHFWQNIEQRIDVSADAPSVTACQTKTTARRTDASGAHQVPFSRLFIPMHIIL